MLREPRGVHCNLSVFTVSGYRAGTLRGGMPHEAFTSPRLADDVASGLGSVEQVLKHLRRALVPTNENLVFGVSGLYV
jgi:hypothetical protein